MFSGDVFHWRCIFFIRFICYTFGIQYIFSISFHPAVSFKSVYRLVAENKIIQLENAKNYKNAFFLSSTNESTALLLRCDRCFESYKYHF